MEQSVIARKKPYLVEVKSGKRYFWCACGLSKRQPFCDGSHAGTSFEPVNYVAEADGEILFCGCKQSAAPPICDGSHNDLSDTYAEADPVAKTAVEEVPRTGGGGKTMLDGGCYVRALDAGDGERRGNLQISPLVLAADGAHYLSAYALHAGPGATPHLSAGDSDIAIFVMSGDGTAQIAGLGFSFGPETSLYVRPGEAFGLVVGDGEPLKAIAVVCPQNQGLSWLDDDAGKERGASFDLTVEERAVGINVERREAMADRFFQVLIGNHIAGAEATMFIGDVPRSRAEPHHHLYEEVIAVLSGEGYMWTESQKTAVGPGDVIFLPQKQVHSLECTVDEGLHLLGAFYPAGSPAINY